MKAPHTWAERSCPEKDEGSRLKAKGGVEEWLQEVTPEVEVAAGTRERKPEVKVAVMGKGLNLAEMALGGYWLCKGCRHVVGKEIVDSQLPIAEENGTPGAGTGPTCERCKGVMELVPGIFFGMEGAS